MYDIAIIGGGMAGAALACALAGEDVSIALVEERPARGAHPHGDDARGIALSQSSRRILDEAGLWSRLAPLACPVERVHVSRRGRIGCVRLSAGILGLEALGYVVPAPELGRVLFAQLAAHDNIDLFRSAAAETPRHDRGSIAVRLRQAAGQTAISARLLVLADGASSNLGNRVGIKTRIHDYRQTAIVTNVTVSRAHRNTACERFIPGGLVAVLPLRGGSRCVTALVSPSEQSENYLRLDDGGYLALLQRALGKRLGELSGPGPRQSWPLLLSRPQRQTAERVVLLGNAAHTVHPNGAQGFNLTLRDVDALAGLLRETLRDGGDVGAPALLNAYESCRQADQRQVVRCTDLLQKTSGLTGPFASAVVGSMMLALDTLPGLKQAFARRATGLHFKPPARVPDGAPGSSTAARARSTRRGVEARPPAQPAGRVKRAPSNGRRAPTARAPDTELLVIGGGVAGNAMALLAAADGMDCILVDHDVPAPRPAPEADARALALTPASRQILTRARAWQQLAQRDLGPFRQLHVWDENGSGELFFDSADIDLPTLGHIVPQHSLVRALASARAAREDITALGGLEPVRLSAAGNAVRVTLSDGREVSAKLLVAADGTRSKVRQLAGIGYPVRPYRQTAVAGIVRTELPHGQVARQRFLSDGPLAFLPMADPHQCGVVWSTAPGHADELLGLDDAAFQRALQEAFEHTLGAVTGVHLRQGFPLRRAQARRYCSERVALVGDAAHCVHPLAGLGANLGLLDVAGLCQLAGAARRTGRDPGGQVTLRRYERWRKGENFMVMMTLEGLKYLFENQVLPVPALRNAGMEWYDSFQALKNFTMRRATGLAGDLPELVKSS